MTWELERPKYVAKLKGIIDGIDRILALKNTTIITDDISGNLRKLRDEAAILLPKLEKDEFEIAVVGVEKSGKSTFTNALLDCVFAPSKEERCTYTSTCIRAGDEDSATVSFYGRDEFIRRFQPKLEEMKLPGLQNYQIDTLSLPHFEAQAEQMDPDLQKKYPYRVEEIKTVLKNWGSLSSYFGRPTCTFGRDQLSTPEFQGYITDADRAIAVKEITIQSARLKGLKMHNAVMYDVPGFNSPTEMHPEQTVARMKTADAIIMVARANEPTPTGDVHKIFKESDSDGTRLSDKLFVFANKVDLTSSVDMARQSTEAAWSRMGISVHKDRIIFGSAAAYLYTHEELRTLLSETEQISAENAHTALERNKGDGRTDGIDALREKLRIYHTEDRSKILQQRVDRIPPQVENVFREIDISSSASLKNERAYVELGLSTYRRLSGCLKDDLEKIKEDTNEKVLNHHPLSEKIRNYVESSISSKSCPVTEEDTRRLHRSVVGVNSDVEQPQKVDSELREEFFRKLHKEFCDGVLSEVNAEHSEICKRMAKIFLSHTDPELDGESKAQLEQSFISLCGISMESDNIYYQSLVERFSRDLFEILLKFSRGPDRLNKFRKEAANFFSLGVFYNASMAETEEEPLAFTSISIEDSPLWKLLLYPEKLSNPEAGDVIEHIRKLTGLGDRVKGVLPLVKKLIIQNGPAAIQVADRLFSGFSKSKSEADIYSNVIQQLQSELEKGETSAQVLHDILSGNRYVEEVGSRPEYNYAVVREELHQDIDALRQVLLYALIPAVSIDKAFCARETKMIEDVIELVVKDPDSKFQEFLTNNLHIIAHTESNRLDQLDAQNRSDELVKEQIHEILTCIKST